MILFRLFAIYIILSLPILEVSAQSNLTLQKAFQNSYKEESRKNYTKAIGYIKPYYNDENYEVSFRMGWLYYLSKDYRSSINYYNKAVKIRPSAIEAKFALIKPLVFLKDLDKVMEQYKGVLKIDPQNKQANYWTGVLTYNKKDYKGAIKYFTKVVEAYPFDYDGNHMMAWALLLSNRKEAAKTCFERALLIKPGDSSSMDGLSKASK